MHFTSRWNIPAQGQGSALIIHVFLLSMSIRQCLYRSGKSGTRFLFPLYICIHLVPSHHYHTAVFVSGLLDNVKHENSGTPMPMHHHTQIICSVCLGRAWVMDPQTDQLKWSPSPSFPSAPRLRRLRMRSSLAFASAASRILFLRSYTARTQRRICSFPSP